jgi:hypothetical protein
MKQSLYSVQSVYTEKPLYKSRSSDHVQWQSSVHWKATETTLYIAVYTAGPSGLSNDLDYDNLVPLIKDI